MSEALLSWVARTLGAGGLLLLAVRLGLVLIRQPARQKRVAEWALVAALAVPVLALLPAWLVLPCPWPTAGTRPDEEGGGKTYGGDRPGVADREEGAAPLPAVPGLSDVLAGEADPGQGEVSAVEPAPALRPEVGRGSVGKAAGTGLAGWLVTGYLAGGLVVLARWGLAHARLARLLRRTGPAPERVLRLVGRMNPGGSSRVRASEEAAVPFSCGLLWPTVVLPGGFCREASEQELRWVLAHELAHLRHRDGWATLLFGLGQGFYYCLPWFWGLRRQVRLCQEYIADAAAAEQPVEYAQLLLDWTTGAPVPAGATGVFGPSSDLFRRVKMLLKSSQKVEPCCPRRWSLLAGTGILSLAVVGAGIGLTVRAAPVPEKKVEPKKVEPKAERPEAADPFGEEGFPGGFPGMPDFERLFKGLPEGAFPPEQMKQMREQMERVRKEMGRAMEGRGLPPAPFVLPEGPLGMLGGRQGVRLGIQVQKPSATLIEQLDLPEGQGLVIEQVREGSPAAEVGLKAHDILLEVDGKPVSHDVAELRSQLEAIKPDQAVEVVILRKGRKETLKGMKLPEVKDVGRRGFPGAGGRLPLPLPFNPGRLPGLRPNLGFGGNGVVTSTVRTNDSFTTRHQEGGLKIVVEGKVEDGGTRVTGVTIEDGDTVSEYAGVDQVPEEYREKVKSLVEAGRKATGQVD